MYIHIFLCVCRYTHIYIYRLCICTQACHGLCSHPPSVQPCKTMVRFSGILGEDKAAWADNDAVELLRIGFGQGFAFLKAGVLE